MMLGGSVKAQHIMPDPRAVFRGWLWGNSASWGLEDVDLFLEKGSSLHARMDHVYVHTLRLLCAVWLRSWKQQRWRCLVMF